jgi:hypothetical protein
VNSTRPPAHLTVVLPSHLEERGANIRRPGSFGCSTAIKPVPLQLRHSCSLIGSFGHPAVLRRIVLPCREPPYGMFTAGIGAEAVGTK